MKKWDNPEILELDVRATEQGGRTFEKVDLNTYDSNGNAVTYYES